MRPLCLATMIGTHVRSIAIPIRLGTPSSEITRAARYFWQTESRTRVDESCGLRAADNRVLCAENKVVYSCRPYSAPFLDGDTSRKAESFT